MKTKSDGRFKPPKKTAVAKKSVRRSKTQNPTHYELFKDLIGSIKDAPSDLARNHDHYAHGAPKRFK